jgi:predicted nuclease of predicted toxin-antitoxin system
MRTVITADLDYPRLIATAGSDSPSLILFRGGDWTEAHVRTRLAEVLSVLSNDEIQGSIITIDRDRVRRRRLPIP